MVTFTEEALNGKLRFCAVRQKALVLNISSSQVESIFASVLTFPLSYKALKRKIDKKVVNKNILNIKCVSV